MRGASLGIALCFGLTALSSIGCDSRVEDDSSTLSGGAGGTQATAGSSSSGAAGLSSGGSSGGATTGGASSGGSSGAATGGASSGGSSGSNGGGGSAGSGGTTASGNGQIQLTDGTLHVLPLGDSITLGVGGGYRNLVYTKLTQAGLTVDMVGSQTDDSTEIADKNHEGHSGFSTTNVRDGIDGWLSGITAPDLVLVMIGTNDVAWWIAEPVSAVADRLFGLVDHLRQELPNAVIVIGTIAPESSSLVDPNQVDRATLASDYNNQLKTRAPQRADFGEHVVLADINAALTVSDLYDGIHPTREAHDKIADAWYDAIAPLLPAN